MSNHARNIRRGNLHGRSLPFILGAALLAVCGASSAASAATLCVYPKAQPGCETTIGAAVAAASAGDTILVAQGRYKEQVTITKSLSLIPIDHEHPIIDATGLSNGIEITGIAAAPNAGVANVLVSGFIVRNANYEGILVVNGADITLVGNHVMDNDKLLDIATPLCPNIPKFETSEDDDCGEGIHLIAAEFSTVANNEVDHNSGGILVSDETGSSHNNLITGNSVHDNPFDCGITMASHPPATSVIPTATVSFGVIRNTVAHNTSQHNGFQVPGAGAGVGIFAPGPGATAAENVVIDNQLLNNGVPGVAMHNHAWSAAPAPAVNFNGNVIVRNHFSGNGQDTADTATSGPTGINIASLAPIYGTVVSQNDFDNEEIGVAFKAPAGQLDLHLNDFDNAGTGVENLGAGSVNAVENWWHCPAGPASKRCAAAVGPMVAFTPWLTAPFADADN